MKKFLIFLVAIVVVVSFGLTIFYFVRNDEVINFTTKEIYCNVGDVISQSQLGLTVKKRNKKTTYNYNAGGEEVSKLVNYNAEYGQYEVGSEIAGGDVTLVITTSNKNSARFEIILHIGDGSKEHPYYVQDADVLENIGSKYKVAGYYLLRKDLVLNSNFKPANEFKGYFYGNGHTISGLTLNGSATYAGLFNRLNGATVEDLKLANVSIDGEFNYAGALAGEVANSTISCVGVENSTIGSTKTDAVVGGLAGKISTSNNVASCYVDGSTLIGNGTVGGLVGLLDRSILRATYAVADFKTSVENANAVLGGLVGEFDIDRNLGSIQQSYAYATTSSANAKLGSFIGKISRFSSFVGEVENQKVFLVGNYAVGEDANRVITYDESLFGGLDADELYKVKSISETDVENGDLSKVEFVFFQTTSGKTLWEDTNAWYVSTDKLPILRMAKEFQGLTAEFVNSEIKGGPVGGDSSDASHNRTELTAKLNNPSESFALKEGFTYDMTGVTIDSPKDIKGITILGNNATIDNLTVNGCLFNDVNNCTIKDVKFTNLKIIGTAKGLLGKVFSDDAYAVSTISNVTVSFKEGTDNYIKTVDEAFGGVAAVVDNGTIIDGATVENLTVDATSTTAYVAGLVGKLVSGVVSNSKIDKVKLAGAQYIAGAVAENTGRVSTFEVVSEATISANNAKYVGGVVAINNGTVEDAKSLTSIEITASTANDAHIGGLVADNNSGAKLINSEFAGSGIVITDLGGLTNLYVGGVAAYNYGKIENDKVTATKIDLYNANSDIVTVGKNFNVGGVAYQNNGSIVKTVVKTDILGNTVAGVVVETNGSVDQVYVGKDAQRNLLAGNKFVAGVAYNVTATGAVSNVQTYTTIEGKANDTVSSLVVLLFPNGATFKDGVINNAATGFGKLYTETWTDYATPNSFNLFGEKTSAGSFTSVVINNANIASTLSVKSSYFSWTLNWFRFNTAYNFSGNTNFFAYAGDEDFTKSSTFTGSTTVVANGDNSEGWKFWWNDEFTYNWTFDTESVWNLNDGIQLAFLTAEAE